MMRNALRFPCSLAMLLVWLCLPCLVLGADDGLVEQGRKIYTQGLLVSGQRLEANRGDGERLGGQQAACISCHRASGMGSVEGTQRVSAINQRYLFAMDGDLVMANMDGRRGKTVNQSHAPYTDASLARALDEGIAVDHRVLSTVMPRFSLTPQDLAALSAYLRQLSSAYSPGVSKQTIRFASIITPDVSPKRREIFKAMLQAALVSKNSSTSPRKRYMTSAASFATQTERRWEVQVWELNGAPETWGAQLTAFYNAWPVFAVLSGVADSTWAPVDAFCKTEKIPCWFPITAVPTAGTAGYGLYFSRGVELQAQVLARYLHSKRTLAAGVAAARRPARVVQIHSGGSGDVAAQAFRQALEQDGMDVMTTALPTDEALAPVALRAALKAVRPDDAVALWLAPHQLQWLAAIKPPAGVQFYVSGSQADSGNDLAPAWKPVSFQVYPYELPQLRGANLAYLYSWLKLRNLPLVDEPLQSELFFALNLMTDTLQDMLDNLYRDYLIERTEDMLGKREASKVEQENRDRVTLGRMAHAAVVTEMVKGRVVSEAGNAQDAQKRAFGSGDSAGTTVYPHLTLGPGQRFASRGAYIVRASPNGEQLTAVSDWIIP
ncbi:c-type cytochrome [Actimicrobium sp. CCI2.3]|uniref:cytochrome c/ABC transporter substrate-binding protein n=1 Tax=Actimicrobium sp. CCI2.3 TaxID=3048616 RepID=UPI002AB360AF|nr:c-type cytochrome [Actimicrobium sp. CCI2.3]MDY7574587.1 c-type cytochrome [Actimicrobium sp. CCI2.3]MEB0020963.1 c-type cytochrome [Actimicrobium sp. CCI2.3]